MRGGRERRKREWRERVERREREIVSAINLI
jgi:hypothetical protein